MYAQLYNYQLVRFNPEDMKCVPFTNGVDITFMGQKTKAIPVPAVGGGRSFQDGLGVAPNGDIYVVVVEASDKILRPQLAKVGQATKTKSFRAQELVICGEFLQVYAPDGTLKDVSAIPGLGHCNGVRVARNGNVLLSCFLKPKGQKTPDGIAAGMPFFTGWGTLVCFDSAFDKSPIGRFHGTYETPGTANPTHVDRDGHQVTVEPIRWDYGGVTFSGAGCVCANSRCDLDGFDRSWVPTKHTYSVNVLDFNGNLITRIGTYGNSDSRGKDSPVADPKTGQLRPKRQDDPAALKPPKELADEICFRDARYVTVSDEALYAADIGCQRVVRCALGYAAEETVGIGGQ